MPRRHILARKSYQVREVGLNLEDRKTEAEKKTMRRYLLGDLSDEEKAHLELRMLSDAAYFERLSALEETLIEAYVHSELEEPERERFDHYFMQSPVQRARVERAALALRALESARRQDRKVIPLRPWQRRWAVSSALAAAALMIALIAPKLVIQRTRLRVQNEQFEAALRREHQLQQQLREQQTQANMQIAQLSEQLSALRAPQLNSPIVDLYPRSSLRSADLARPADWSAPTRVTAPNATRTVILLLHSASQAAGRTYRLEILNAANRVIWQGEGLVRQPTGEYSVSVPTELLPSGRYKLQVYADTRQSDQPVNGGRRVLVESYRMEIAASR